MKSIAMGSVAAAVIFAVIYLAVVGATGEVGTGNLVVALTGGIACAMVAALIGATVRRARQR